MKVPLAGTLFLVSSHQKDPFYHKDKQIKTINDQEHPDTFHHQKHRYPTQKWGA